MGNLLPKEGISETLKLDIQIPVYIYLYYFYQ